MDAVEVISATSYTVYTVCSQQERVLYYTWWLCLGRRLNNKTDGALLNPRGFLELQLKATMEEVIAGSKYFAPKRSRCYV